MQSRSLPIDRALALLAVAGLLAACGGPSFRGSVMDEPVPVPDFTLQDHTGQPFRLADQRGNVVLLFFGYTSCPDVCPTTLATWRQVHDLLGDEAGRTRFVFVTVDPERDTGERLGRHVQAFNPDFLGLTGTPEQLQEALNHQKAHGGKLGFNLVKLGFIKDEEITALLSKQYGVPSIDLGQFEIDPLVVKLIPPETAQKYQIIPVSRSGATLTIAMTEPTNVFAMDDIKFMTGYNVEPVVAWETAVSYTHLTLPTIYPV